MIVIRQNITIGICISNPTSQCGYLLKILYRNAKLCFINVVHIRSPNSTLRSYGKERPVPKVMFMRMTEILNNTTAFCRLKAGCRAGRGGGMSFYIWHKRVLKWRENELWKWCLPQILHLYINLWKNLKCYMLKLRNEFLNHWQFHEKSWLIFREWMSKIRNKEK